MSTLVGSSPWQRGLIDVDGPGFGTRVVKVYSGVTWEG